MSQSVVDVDFDFDVTAFAFRKMTTIAYLATPALDLMSDTQEMTFACFFKLVTNIRVVSYMIYFSAAGKKQQQQTDGSCLGIFSIYSLA